MKITHLQNSSDIARLGRHCERLLRSNLIGQAIATPQVERPAKNAVHACGSQ
jgi:hypothetical protein